MARNNTDSSSPLPGFRHVLEAALVFGVLCGLADASYLYARWPDISADLGLALRFAHSTEFLTALAYLPYLTIILLILRPVVKARGWTLETSLSMLYFTAILPAGVVFVRRLAGMVAAESLLVEGVKADYYFVKYVWLLIPLAWAISASLARLRTKTPFTVLSSRVVAFAFAATAFLIFTPMWQGHYLLARANIYSGVDVGPEIRLILVGVLVLSVIFLFVATWLIGLLAKPARGRLLAAFLIVVFILPFLPPIFAGPPTAGTKRSQTQLQGRPSNVVLVSLDTTRIDDIGCYGSEVTTTPNIDSVALDATCFDNAITPMPLTGPAHMSMLTGLQSEADIGHGVKSNGILLSEDIPTLATELNEAGYKTSAIIGGWPMSRQATGLHRGFHYYHDIFHEGIRARFLPDQIWSVSVLKLLVKYLRLAEFVPMGRTKYADTVTDQTIEWLDDNSDDPFFLFVHYYDPHYLYSPKAPYDAMYTSDYDGPYKGRFFDQAGITRETPNMTAEDIGYYRDMYRGEISFVDREFGRLLEWGDSRGIWDNTLLIITADHGESFEHNYYFAHTDRVYEPLIHVPLIIRNPDALAEGISGNRIDTLVNLSDIYFSILSFLDLQPSENPDEMHDGVTGSVEGWDHDLLPLMTGEAPEGETQSVGWNWIASQSFDFAGPGETSLGRFYTFRFPQSKLMFSPDSEPIQPVLQYFDLVSDPDELIDLYPEIAEGDDIREYVAPGLVEWSLLQTITDDTPRSFEALEELNALGYTQRQ